MRDELKSFQIISLFICCCVSQDMRVNNNQLQSSYETLSKNHSKLQNEVKNLKDEIKGEKNRKCATVMSIYMILYDTTNFNFQL